MSAGAAVRYPRCDIAFEQVLNPGILKAADPSADAVRGGSCPSEWGCEMGLQAKWTNLNL